MGNSLRKHVTDKTQPFPPKNVIMVGLDETGKTTILHRICSEINTHEPVSGLTVESMKYKNLTINAWNIGINDDKIRSEWDAVLRLVYQSIDGIIFVIDSADRIRIDNYEGFLWNTARRHFDMLLEEDYAQDAAILILANKQDVASAMNIDTISKKLELNTLRNRQWFITSCTASVDDNADGIYKGLQWLLHTLNHNKYCITSELKSILLISGYIREITEECTFWIGIPVEIVKFIHLLFKNADYDYTQYKYYGEYDDGTANDMGMASAILLMQFVNRKDCKGYIDDDEEFIESLNGRLDVDKDEESSDKWNHYKFMRMIWILFQLYDRRNGLKRIWKYTPYNVTKTYFWSQLIYFGMNRDIDNNFAKKDFQYFLIINPSFSNDYNVLMNKYYSKTLLHKMEENEDEMILPDLMSLPSLITNIKRVKVKIRTGEYKRFKESDQVFLRNFEHKSFKCWEGHTSFLRVIWCYVNRLEAQYTSIIQNKWREFDTFNYNMTKTYFWIHCMRYYMKLYKDELLLEEKCDNNCDNEVVYSFQGFLQFCSRRNQCKMEYSEWFNEFYSHKLLQNTLNDKLVFPDLKSLPSF